MEIQSTKIKYQDVVRDWFNDLKDLDRRKRPQFAALAKKGEPIVIDYGSDTIKAGFLGSPSPELVFKPLVSKTKESTAVSFSSTINFNYDQMDILKNNFRTVFEKNIIQHFSLFQHCNDFLFSELAVCDESIKSPLIITEPFANPVYCRHHMIELFFEGYGVNEVFLANDALLAYFHEIGYNMHEFKKQSRLLINFGANVTHIVSIIRGKIDFESIKRINIGGWKSFEMFGKLITLKNPQLKNYLTFGFLKHTYNKYCHVALDYKMQLKYFREGQSRIHKSYKNQIEEQNKKMGEAAVIQPIEIEFERPSIEVSPQELKRKEEIRKRMADRLKEALQKKREEKKKIYQNDYQELLKIKEKYKEDPQNMKQQLVNIFGEIKPVEIMNRKIKQLEIKLEIQSKEQEQKKFALLDIPDNELPVEKQRLKKLQQYQKAAFENRKKKQQQHQQQQQKMRQLRQENPEKYMRQLHERYKILSDKIKESERIKSELSNRNSRLNQKRMQTLAQLAEENEEEDNFGENDQDWLVYKGYEESDHRSEFQAVEVELREIDPDWIQNSDKHHLNTGYNLYLSTEMVKCVEIYFQPSLVGNQQANLPDTIYRILRNYPKDIQNELLQSILFVGGGAAISGMKERLEKELICNFEQGSHVNISITKQPKLGAYFGMKGLATKYPEYIKQNSVKKAEYFLGNLLNREHDFGKIYF